MDNSGSKRSYSSCFSYKQTNLIPPSLQYNSYLMSQSGRHVFQNYNLGLFRIYKGSCLQKQWLVTWDWVITRATLTWQFWKVLSEEHWDTQNPLFIIPILCYDNSRNTAKLEVIILENLSGRHEDIFCSFELYLAPLQFCDGNINYANLSLNWQD